MASFTKPDADGRIRDNFFPNEYRFRTPEELQTGIHFNEEKSLDRMRQYVTGMQWEVDFFTQNTDYNTPTKDPDITEHITSNNYTRICNLILYVTTPITQGAKNELSGSATINAGFLVKQGDTFIANLIGGRVGLFTITNVTAEHYNLHQVFNVDFKIFKYIDKDVKIMNNILSKVTKTYIYNKEYGIEGTSQLLTVEETALRADVDRAIADIGEYYFKTFLDLDTKHIQLPTDDSSTSYVDQELNKFVRSVFSTKDCPDIARMQTVDYRMDKSVHYTVWDVIRKRDPNLLRRTEPFIGFKPSPYTKANLNSLEAKYMDVEFIVDKIDTDYTLAGVIENKTMVDEKLKGYNYLPKVQLDRKKEELKNVKDFWEINIPGLDFETELMKEEKKREEDKKKQEEKEANIKEANAEITKLMKSRERVEEAIAENHVDEWTAGALSDDVKNLVDTLAKPGIDLPGLKLDDINQMCPVPPSKREDTEESKSTVLKVNKQGVPTLKATKQYNMFKVKP